MTDKTAKIEIFRVKLGEYYRADDELQKINRLINAVEDSVTEDDDFDLLYNTHKALYDSESAALDKVGAIVKTLCSLFNDITHSNVTPMHFLAYLDSEKFRRMAITA